LGQETAITIETEQIKTKSQVLFIFTLLAAAVPTRNAQVGVRNTFRVIGRFQKTSVFFHRKTPYTGGRGRGLDFRALGSHHWHGTLLETSLSRPFSSASSKRYIRS
jgi:hypothetical protein